MSFGPGLRGKKLHRKMVWRFLLLSVILSKVTGQAAFEEMYFSTVEEESGDESMLLGTSTGAEGDLEESQENGIWERRRSAIFKK